MRLVYKFNLKYNDRLYELCKISKNLYNQALYIVKEELNTNNKWLSYYDLNKILPSAVNLEGTINYKLLKAQVSQQCLKVLDKNVKSYIKSIKDYSKNKSKYKGCPKFPKFKKELNQLIYPNQSCRIKDGRLYLSKDLSLKIPQFDVYGEKLESFQQVRIIPKLNKSFVIEIVYIDNISPNSDLNYDSYSSIDLGIDNLAAMIFPNSKPLLFNGKQLKAKNQYFNKVLAKEKSKLNHKVYSSNKIRNLYSKRENQATDIFHKLSRMIINNLLDHNIGNLVVGYNKGWKDSINIGKRNNQAFCYISYDKLLNFLKYKCEMTGIKLTIHEESYSSKCDSLVLEPVKKHESYSGQRIKRGLFQSSCGKLINADVNGSLNILRKVVGDSLFIKEIIDSGWLFQPLRVNIL